MKAFFITTGLVLVSTVVLAQVTNSYGESRSTIFSGAPGIMLEISGNSARQLMLKLEVEQQLNPNGQIIKRGKNVYCILESLKSKCLIRLNNDGTAGEWQQ